MSLTIGICGPSGSGKSTLARLLSKDLDANLINLDNYFLLDPPVKKYEHNEANWELPENLDWTLIKHDVRGLLNGTKSTITKMNWDDLVYDKENVAHKDTLVIEGFLLLHDEELRSLLDLAVYIDIPDAVGVERRLIRTGIPERRERYEKITFPEYASRRSIFEGRADLVLNGEHPVPDNLERILLKVAEIKHAKTS